MSTSTIEFKKFDFTSIPRPFKIGITGSRRSGKNTIALHIIETFQKSSPFTNIAAVTKFPDEFANQIGRERAFSVKDFDNLELLLKEQYEKVAFAKTNKQTLPSLLIVCKYEPWLMQSNKFFENLFLSGNDLQKDFNTSIILISQRSYDFRIHYRSFDTRIWTNYSLFFEQQLKFNCEYETIPEVFHKEIASLPLIVKEKCPPYSFLVIHKDHVVCDSVENIEHLLEKYLCDQCETYDANKLNELRLKERELKKSQITSWDEYKQMIMK